jgi:GntR family transcriptional regulator
LNTKRSFVPAYYEIAVDLCAAIEQGQLRPGEMIPSESQLCERYGVSRMTVRQGLNLLSDAGYIQSLPGKGSYVLAPELGRVCLELQEGVLADGRHLEPRLVGVQVVAAEVEVARMLRLSPGTKVVELLRLSLLEGEPVAFEEKYLPYSKRRPLVEREIKYAAFPKLVAESCDSHLVKVRTALYASAAPPGPAAHLRVEEGSPALVLEQTVLAQDDQILGWGRTFGRADDYVLGGVFDPFWRRL